MVCLSSFIALFFVRMLVFDSSAVYVRYLVDIGNGTGFSFLLDFSFPPSVSFHQCAIHVLIRAPSTPYSLGY